MDNPFTQYSVGRSIGLSVLGAGCFTVISVVVWPFVALAMWATPEKADFGKWGDRKNFNLIDREQVMNPKFNVGSTVIADGDVAKVTQIIPPPDSDMFTGPISYAVEWPTNEWGTFTEDELKESDFNTPSDEEMVEMMKNPEFAEFVKSMPRMPKAEPWPPEPGTWKLNRNKD